MHIVHARRPSDWGEPSWPSLCVTVFPTAFPGVNAPDHMEVNESDWGLPLLTGPGFN